MGLPIFCGFDKVFEVGSTGSEGLLYGVERADLAELEVRMTFDGRVKGVEGRRKAVESDIARAGEIGSAADDCGGRGGGGGEVDVVVDLELGRVGVLMAGIVAEA